jgi:outer membrane receptor protein involved in Fe transport
MKRFAALIVAGLAVAVAPAVAQEAPVHDVPEVTVTATRTSRDTFELPQTVTILDREELAGPGAFVVMKGVVRRDAGIWYDERTSTTVDPIIRGFAGFNLLTLVDGNTLSTLWGEGGFGADDMYGKIDPEIVERIEILHGPSSALYGSNALGAVINVITRVSPLDFTKGGWEWGARSKGDVYSAASAAGFRQELYGASPDFRFLLGGSARQWDDLRGGGDVGLLTPSGGRERNWDFSGELKLAEDRTLRMTVQDVNRDHVARYYRPTQDNANRRQAAGLFYNDASKGGLLDDVEARLYWQEKRDERRFFSTVSEGYAETTTYQAGWRGTRDVGGGHVVTGGVSLEMDEGDSPDDEQFTITRPAPKRRAAPLSEWWDLGVYAQDEWRISRPFSLVASGRYDTMKFKTDVDAAYVPPLGNAADDEITERNSAVTGGLGVVARASDNVHFTANWARGFRQNAPNFGVRQLGDGVLIPNGLLDPTTSDNFEVGVKTRGKGFRLDASYYRSYIRNWQGDFRNVPSYNGQTYLDVNGNGVQDANEGFVRQVEGGDATVHGVEVRGDWHPHEHFDSIPVEWSTWASYAWNRGRVDGTRAHPQSEPLRHTQPMRLLVGLRWDEVSNPKRALFVEVIGDMVGRFDDIPSDRVNSDLAWRRDPQDGTSPLLRDGGGTPGYVLVHVYAGMKLAENADLRFGIENAFDRKHRAAHSRMDGPGVSILGSLEVRF